MNGPVRDHRMDAVVTATGGFPAAADVSTPKPSHRWRVADIERTRGPVDILGLQPRLHDHRAVRRSCRGRLVANWTPTCRARSTWCGPRCPECEGAVADTRRHASEWGAHRLAQCGCATPRPKPGLIALTKSLGRELAPENITVNAIAPGIIDTRQLQVDADDAGLTLTEMHEEYARGYRSATSASPMTSPRPLAAGPRRSARLGRPDHPDQRRDNTMPDMTQRPSPYNRSTGRRPALRGLRPVRAAATHRRRPDLRRRRGGYSVRYRSELSTGRALRTRPRSAMLAGAAAYHPQMEVMSPFATQQVVDAGDIACTPFDIAKAMIQIEEQASHSSPTGRGSSRSVATTRSPTHCCVRTTQSTGGWRWCTWTRLDTWDTYFDAPLTHGTPFRRAAEEGSSYPATAPTSGSGSAVAPKANLSSDANSVSPSCTAATSKHVPSQTWLRN